MNRRGGFTLVEMTVVVALIAIVLSVALPRLVPAIAYSTLEGAARHVANFGRGAIAQCAVSHERFTVRFDLDHQEYWAVRWPVRSSSLGLFDEKKKKDEKESDRSKFADIDLSATPAGQMSEEDLEARALAMQEQFERFARMSLMARAQRLKKNEGILSEIGPLFEKEFTLDEEETEGEEVRDMVLERTRVPEGVVLETVRLGDVDHVKGLVEVEIEPTGLSEPVEIYLRGERGDYFTVVWDAITGGSHIYPGKGTTP